MLAWFEVHQRKLPWRSVKPDPWHVLVSEAMLQQTQVTTVIGYFDRFIAAYPTPGSLARADEQAVLRMWQGLGYYRRARHLHAAAKRIVAEHDGQVPDDMEALRKLPGVGRYTAGAVASIAFGRCEPIVDGNVARVLARWFAIKEPADDPKVRARLWELAAELADGERPGELNQALMELGALICVPRAPRCLACPVSKLCEANQRGIAADLPVRGEKRAPSSVTHHAIAVERGGKFLFTQRPAKGLWANMWQLPTSEEQKKNALVEWLGAATGIAVGELTEAGQFTHQTTHRTIRFVVWNAKAQAGRLRRGAGVWRALDDVEDLPLATAQRKAIALIRGGQDATSRGAS